MLRDFPFAFFYFTSYEVFKNIQRSALYHPNTDIDKLKAYNHFLAGAGMVNI